MDSLSQAALGASLLHATLGSIPADQRRWSAARTLTVGAALGTLPDLDVIVRYADAVESFTYHRSYSHSLWVLSALSLPLAGLLRLAFKDASFKRVWLAVWLVLFTHPLLDALTVYGTQIWWPMDVPPTAWGSLFIIDPMYTAPLLIGIVWAWRQRRSSWRNQRRAVYAVLAGLCVSSAYAVWTLAAQQQARTVAERALQQQGISADALLVAPSPLSVLWRLVAQDGQDYLEGYTSLFDTSDSVSFQRYPRNRQVLGEAADWWSVQRLEWFTGGFVAYQDVEGVLRASDLRMGLEADYVFEFELGVRETAEAPWQTQLSVLRPPEISLVRVRDVFRRMVDEDVSLVPESYILRK